MSLPGDLTTIKVTASFPNIAGQPQTGSVEFDPGQPVADSTGAVILTGAVTARVFNGVMQPVILPCTDNAGLNPTGFQYTITETISSNVRAYKVSLPHSLGDTADLSSLTPAADAPAADAFATANTWTSTQTFAGSPGLKITDGATDGDVLTSDADGNATWQAPTGGGGGSGLTNPMSAPGDMIYGASAGAATRLAAQTSTTKKFLTETGTGSAGQAPTWSTISGSDVPTLNQNTTGTAANITGTLDLVPAPAGNVSLNSHKVTNLTNGSASSDAAAFGQIPTSAGSIGGLLAADNLSDVANAATARTNLGLGTAATQASSAFDAAGAATTAQSNAEAYTDTETTRAETAEALKLAKASNLSDLANAGTARTNLGLGTAATHASTDFDAAGAAATAQSAAEAASVPIAGGTMTGELSPAVASLTFGSSIAVNAALGNVFAVTLTASTGTLANPSNPVDGQTIRVRVIQDGTGGWTLAYDTAYDFGASSAPTLSTGANKVDILGFEYVASLSKWCFLGSGLGF